MRSAELVMLAVAVAGWLPAVQRIDPAEIQLQAAINKETIEGDLKGAISQYQKILNTRGVSRSVAAKALLHVGQCHEKLGSAEARKAYARVLKDYADQPEAVRQARERLTTLAKAATASSKNGLQGRRVIGPSHHLRGGVSPDGRYIAYCCMVVHEVATGRHVRFSIKTIGDGDTYTFDPRFSPDSDEIAYVVQSEEAPALRVVKRTGSDERVLFSDPNVRRISLIDWMPDGKDLLATLERSDKTTELALVPAAGGAPQRIKSPAPSSDGRLSPDGRYFAYRAQPAGAAGAWVTGVFALDGSLTAPLVERPANAWNIGWTQDGKFLFYSAASGSEGIWAVRVAEGRAQGLPERIVGSRIENSTEPIGLTRAGAFFYYTQSWDFLIHLMEIDPVSRTLKPSRVLNANSPDWSPDGRYLAYAQYPQEGLISIRTLATGEERTLWTGLTDFIMSLRWFPDQRALATQGFGPEGGGGSVGLRRIDLTSGSLSNILVGQNWREFGANPTFSSDGRLVTYKAWDPVRKVSILTRYNLETRGREVLLERKPPQYVAAFSVLAGTGHIAVVLQEGDDTSSIQLLDPASRELRPIYRTSRGNFIPASILLDWMPDGKSLLFVTSPHSSRTWDSDVEPPFSLFRIPAYGGQPEKLLEAEWIWQIRVHPDGRRIAIETRPPRTETWVVDNLFAAGKM